MNKFYYRAIQKRIFDSIDYQAEINIFKSLI
jgi:hypothetical protein